MITANEIVAKLDEALKKFGTYSFEDKGAQEVMDLKEITSKLEKMTSSKAGEVMKSVAEKHDYGQSLINQLASALDNMPEEWFEDMITISGAEY